ncbi:multidrug resistance protein 1-like protein [Kickxella alabastrina]|uniref:multidrug resistance protein 1-like protein n=1 Tax=Kickxella alabastrina TaxID=61397 RepID=UPI00221EB49F|nr:multidrug resistance protein 1-like protein [Kickxella alabastrina]XP_051393358.1 multidrug resistance protein 1-like protein [Kickxella alabastrina]KAI7832934.1 multidrug resistance protein 1-like protein [Kickxella alabastrina]KAI7832970.1 multidrug resistance protein 1-like protein [Kickxella alabastrina]
MWILSFFVNACWAIAAENQGLRIRKLYYKSILRQDIGWFDTVKTGELTTRITNDVNLVQDGLGEKVGFVFMNVVGFLVSFIIAFVKGWKLTFICLTVMPFIVGAGAILGKEINKLIINGQDKTAASGAIADEVLSGIRTVMAFNGQKREIARYDAMIQDSYMYGRKTGFVLGGCIGAIQFFIFAMYCVGFNFGSWRLRQGEYSPDQVLNVILTLLVGGFMLSGAAPNFSSISTARGSAYRVYAIIDRQSPINPLDTETGKKVDKIRGDISFRNIHFSYPSRPNVPILKGFNLEIRPGQKVALVGESGCGKSTTIGLIERFYDPAQGDVIIDGVNIKEYNIGKLRHRIGIVTQEPVLFATSIMQNIKWGAVDPENNPPTDEEVIEAAKAANAHPFISQLPDGYNTLVGEGGALLSGGQKQRIAIARAIVRNPDVLLLDEATSALDTASERLVQDALDKLSANRTTISIAHRLSTIRNCDQIYVVREGVVSENGTHDELVTLSGEYAAMVRAQEMRQGVRTMTDGDDEEKSSIASEADVNEEGDLDELIAKELKEQALEMRRSTTRQTIESMKRESADTAAAASGKKTRTVANSSDMYLLLRLTWKYKGAMKVAIPGAILALFDGAVMPCFALVFSRALVALSEPDMEVVKRDTNLFANLFLVFSVVGCLAMFGRIGLYHVAGENTTRQVRHDLFVKLMTFESGFFDDDKNGTGALTSRLATDAEEFNKFVGTFISTLNSTVATIICASAIAFVYEWRIALLMLGCWPIQSYAQYWQAQATWGSSMRLRASYEKSGQSAAETIRNIKTVATLRREETFIRVFDEMNDAPHKDSIRSSLYGSFGFGFSQACNMFINSLVFFAGCRFVINGWTEVMDLMYSLMATMFASMAIGTLAQVIPILSKAGVASRGIFETLDRESAINGIDSTGSQVESFEGNVSFDNIKFSYPIRPDTKILKGISFEAIAGKSIALVGASGSGKSTSILLAQRLYDAISGKVSVEGLGVRDWDIMALRNNMAIVGQEPILFNYTIGENIAYGKPGATQLEIEEAAKEANIYNFVQNQPDGFNTIVGQKGGQLSGGQKQRVAIARALIRKPKLLLLDEATAALDSRSEKIVQKVLDKAAKERTTLTVAHRLSTIQDCDMIIVFKSGRIVERGTHDELLAQKGTYHMLVQQQSLQVTH